MIACFFASSGGISDGIAGVPRLLLAWDGPAIGAARMKQGKLVVKQSAEVKVAVKESWFRIGD